MSVKNTEKQKASKFQWFLFVIVIPAIFAVTILFVVLNIAGVNLFDMAEKHNIPVVSALVQSDEDKEKENTQDQLSELQATIKDKDANIEQLQVDNKSKDEKISKLQQTISDLTNQLNQQEEQQQNQTEQIKEVSTTFEEMDPESAAPVVENMEQDVALKVLAEIPSEQRGAILSAMNPELAANLTSELLNQ
ncbi:Flagellar motility protein MotE, a chaperone for MotC folding [Salinibacillus kushneri]|uniref:Flagellar motility protein MotE, a chaperone for MotC folding n=1 Tax=Salinibacillus kushneri TaxID=237682 RepID=A0A1I0EBN8_9BACI|nr:hypothetical protein [Salinibacillus kushneri]SET41780.1 Flagellar motility protein MotE, a chaperone for MotC folding [Salinibacillus kushneri]